METHEILSKDGLKLFCNSYRAKKARASIVLVHGFAEHCGRYVHVIKDLKTAGFNVLTVDLRGHGLSEGLRGYIDHFAQYLDDLDAAVNYAKEFFGEKKVFIMAHSMGALIATFYAASFGNSLAGLVLSSPFYGIPLTVPLHKKVAAIIMSKVMPTFSLPKTIVGRDLSHDPKMAAQYDNDPMIFGGITARWFTEISRSHEMVQQLGANFSTPVLLQIAGDDRIVESSKAISWFDGCASVDKNKIVYDGFFHEIYNELDRQRPIDDMVAWFTARSKSGPGI